MYKSLLESALLGRKVAALLGTTCYDVYLNDVAYWQCVPANVWRYTTGGYQVLKKWLSYRERRVLGRDLHPHESREVTAITRRVAALLLLAPALNVCYTVMERNITSMFSR